MPGTLYVVATPIGNLEDLTFRARRILGEVDLIAAEDTRRTSHLLAHYEIRKPMVSLREHNELRESARIVERLQGGASVAVVTDAGTPGIADPGARLVRIVRAAGLPIVPIPGPSAVTTAMSVSGSLSPEFHFFGFPPVKGEARERWFQQVAKSDVPSVFYEAPHRIERTLDELTKLLVDQHICVCRELTKLNEQLVIKQNTSHIDGIKPIGEFAVVVIPAVEEASKPVLSDDFNRTALNLFQRLVAGGQISDDLAIELVALKLGVGEADAKKAIKKAKISVKQQNN